MFNYSEARLFYTAVLQKMVQRFPFDDAVLQDLVVLDFARRTDFTYAPGMFTPYLHLSYSQSERLTTSATLLSHSYSTMRFISVHQLVYFLSSLFV